MRRKEKGQFKYEVELNGVRCQFYADSWETMNTWQRNTLLPGFDSPSGTNMLVTTSKLHFTIDAQVFKDNVLEGGITNIQDTAPKKNHRSRINKPRLLKRVITLE
jgi:hypothetical protein